MARTLRRNMASILWPVLGFLLVGYFSFHLVNGDRGLLAWRALDQEIARARATLAELAAERLVIERRVDRLQAGSLDPDLLEERGRVILNLVRPDEVILMGDGRAGRPAD
ncbi:MAG: septum formation initiator family protein [Thalassobaculales bacterium]